MTKVDRNIVEQEISQMFDEHKTFQGVIEALLIETGWDANTIRAAQEARQKKQEAVAERQEKKKEAPQKLIQRLALEQKAEQAEDQKSRSESGRNYWRFKPAGRIHSNAPIESALPALTGGRRTADKVARHWAPASGPVTYAFSGSATLSAEVKQTLRIPRTSSVGR